jgi:hypothetical protein
MKEVFNNISNKHDLPKSKVEEIWYSQFNFVFNNMKENYVNENAPSIKLAGLGTFYPNVPQLKKFKEKYDKKHRPEGKIA